MHLIQVNLMVADFQAMLAFYREVLEFALIDLDPGPPCVPMQNWASLDAGGTIIELFDVATFGDRAALQSSGREAVQLAFLVDDVDARRARLVEQGVTCDEAISEQWGRFVRFRDPERNRLQLFQVFDARKH